MKIIKSTRVIKAIFDIILMLKFDDIDREIRNSKRLLR